MSVAAVPLSNMPYELPLAWVTSGVVDWNDSTRIAFVRFAVMPQESSERSPCDLPHGAHLPMNAASQTLQPKMLTPTPTAILSPDVCGARDLETLADEAAIVVENPGHDTAKQHRAPGRTSARVPLKSAVADAMSAAILDDV